MIRLNKLFNNNVMNSSIKGWGCAYRSLQTLLSWFIEQKYAKEGLKVPSIEEI